MPSDLGALPPAARDALAAALGARVTAARPGGSGLAGAVTLRAALGDGREVFVKACPDGHPQAGALRVEGWFGRRAPAGLPAPPLLASARAAGWRALAFAYVPGRAAGPGDLGVCAGLARRIATAPITRELAGELPPVSVALGALTRGWARVAADPPAGLDPWAREHLGLLVELERAWPAWADGDRLTHTDLHPGNVLVTEDGPRGPGAAGEGAAGAGGRTAGEETPGEKAPGGRALAVDWTRPALGAGWVDVVLLHARLGLRPRVAGAPAAGVAALVAGAAGHWADGARLPAPPYAPGLPAHRARSARAALASLRACLEDGAS
jgi:hypothetical protein